MRKYKKTIIGSTILLLLFVMSSLYPFYGPKDYNHQVLVSDAQGKVIGRAPFPLSGEHWLGTNRNGEDLHWLLLYGAKFTLITTFGVALLRVLFGGIVGIFMSLGAPFLKSYFRDFFLTFRYIPSILIAVILMIPIAGGFYDNVPISSIVTYQIIILVFIGFPSVVLFTSDIIDELLKTSFVQSSFLMGAGKIHIFRRQLLPYMRSYGILFTVQQLLSTLHITMQLGIFGLFLGGKNRGGVFGYDEPPKPATLSNEWAGLIGQSFGDLILAPWVAFVPALAYFFVIFIVNMVKKEIEDNLSSIPMEKIKRKGKGESPVQAGLPEKNKFDFVDEEKMESI
jgi:peptide/nickel transport system permease protein